ncbi:MAG: DUF1592 domain-containing protein, partial [Acidobacteria bacterium]|nr:DUF1592 domain-containing protein [Acidobacteriota bacterium]
EASGRHGPSGGRARAARLWRPLVLAGALALTVPAPAAPAAASPQESHAGAVETASPRALLDRYCVTCHNERLRTAGLTLDAMDVGAVADRPEVWEKVVRKLRTGLMPPAGRPRPEPQAYDDLAGWLETRLDRAAAADPDPGRSDVLHRLNRTEYANAIRDLLALEIDAAELLPSDDASYGFDNIASSLRISPTHLDRYLAAARKISRAAVGRAATPPTTRVYTVPGDLSQERHLEGLPLGTRGGLRVRHHFPRSGEYEIRAKLALDILDNIPRYDETHHLDILIDGHPVERFAFAGEPDPEDLEPQPISDVDLAGHRRNMDADWRVRVAVPAGMRDLAATFVGSAEVLTEASRTGALQPLRLALKEPLVRPYAGGFFNDEARTGPYLANLTVTGPFAPGGPGDTPSRRRIFTCTPAAVDEEDACAERILGALARRAYRRPPSGAELGRLLDRYRDGRREAGFEAGVEVALRHVLAHPAFLFRIEREPHGVAPDTTYPIADLELASRLSFFLWSSIPDEELLALAEAGRLRELDVLEQQARRMLADARADELVSNFAAQWLYTRNMGATYPNGALYPDYDDNLRQAMRRETELLFDSILREDRSVIDLLTADYTFVNERLARHYGIEGVYGSRFRRITLADGDPRGGLLGQGSLLTVTSHATRTSPVVRGKWILENILGTPPPEPPPGVPPLQDAADLSRLTMRERMERHRANPACAGCHNQMDPLGLALESFDAVGHLRTVRGTSTAPIDVSGVMPDGTAFEGASGLRDILVGRSDQFVQTLTEKLLTYALGRGVEHHDMPAVRGILRDAAAADYRLSSIVLGVVRSVPFQLRRTSEPDGDAPGVRAVSDVRPIGRVEPATHELRAGADFQPARKDAPAHSDGRVARP